MGALDEGTCARHRMVSVAYSGIVMRMVPVGAGAVHPSRQLSFHPVVQRPHGAEQAFSSLGRRDGARGAGQEPEPKPRLERADGVAQRRLRDTELRSGSGEALLPRHGEEGNEIVEALPGFHEYTPWADACFMTQSLVPALPTLRIRPPGRSLVPMICGRMERRATKSLSNMTPEEIIEEYNRLPEALPGGSPIPECRAHWLREERTMQRANSQQQP